MSVSLLFVVLVVLTIGIWAVAFIAFWYGQKLLELQKQEIKQLLPYLKKIKSDQETLKSLTVSDETPLMKLKDITLPDNVQVNFLHKKRKT